MSIENNLQLDSVNSTEFPELAKTIEDTSVFINENPEVSKVADIYSNINKEQITKFSYIFEKSSIYESSINNRKEVIS